MGRGSVTKYIFTLPPFPVIMKFRFVFNMNKNSSLYFLLIVLVALVVADGIITRTLIIHNLAVESNPFLVAWVSNDTLLIIKLAGAVLASLILWRVSNRKPKAALVVTCVFVAFYTIIVLWNLYVFFLARHFETALSLLPLFNFVSGYT